MISDSFYSPSHHAQTPQHYELFLFDPESLEDGLSNGAKMKENEQQFPKLQIIITKYKVIIFIIAPSLVKKFKFKTMSVTFQNDIKLSLHSSAFY